MKLHKQVLCHTSSLFMADCNNYLWVLLSFYLHFACLGGFVIDGKRSLKKNQHITIGRTMPNQQGAFLCRLLVYDIQFCCLQTIIGFPQGWPVIILDGIFVNARKSACHRLFHFRFTAAMRHHVIPAAKYGVRHHQVYLGLFASVRFNPAGIINL
jgi:hypothetical protein